MGTRSQGFAAVLNTACVVFMVRCLSWMFSTTDRSEDGRQSREKGVVVLQTEGASWNIGDDDVGRGA